MVTSRPTGIPKWIDQCGAEIVALRPLDESSGRSMLDAIPGVSSTTFNRKGRIIRHTASVPLFVEEVCRRLKETGVLRGHSGNLTLDRPVDDLGIPNSVQGVIAARLDRLAKDERSLMQIAAALGSRSIVTTLARWPHFPKTGCRRTLSTRLTYHSCWSGPMAAFPRRR